MAASAYEIRRVLKIYDDSTLAPVNRAITMLTEVTRLMSEKPAAYDLNSNDPEVWLEAGGSSYGENVDFPCRVGDKWMEVLSKPGVVKAAGLTKTEWASLLTKLKDFEDKFNKAELSMERLEEIEELINKLREEAPEAEPSEDEDDDDDDDSDEDDE